jgi:hypothetical protein
MLWFKLTKGGVGGREYKALPPKGVFIASVRDPKESQHTTNYAAKDGAIVLERDCFNGYDRHLAHEAAKSLL